MLARTADNLFWLARSMERADYIARTIEATLRLEYLPKIRRRPDGGVGKRAQRRRRLRRLHRQPMASSTRRAPSSILTFDRPNPSSICNCLENARACGQGGAHRAHRRDLDGDQRRLARTQALRGEPSLRAPARPRSR